MTAVITPVHPVPTFNVLERVDEYLSVFAEEEGPSDDLGRLTDRAAAALRESGVMRMLQPAAYGGFETHPSDYVRACLTIGMNNGSAGWVTGVVGVHAHELAQTNQQLQDDVWGEDPDVWMASPYAPQGEARPVDGGYIFNGHWTFSSGTDHCDWVMIGGWVTDADGVNHRNDTRHFVIPRRDYEILEDSWDVMGLRGTGSKDIVIKDVFVPEYRVIDQIPIAAGTRGREVGLTNPLYSIPRQSLFSGAISTGTIAMAAGVLAEYAKYTSGRKNVNGLAVAKDPFQLSVYGEAAADIQASITHLISDMDKMFDLAATGETVPLSARLEMRRNQGRAVARAVDAADKLFMHSGGNSLQMSAPIQRKWRDMHAGRNHISNVVEPLYMHWALDSFGLELPPHARA